MSALSAQASLLIRRPATEVFDALVEPRMLTRYWLSASSAPLEVGKRVRWEFMVPGAVVDTTATLLERGKQLDFEWSDGSKVRWRFESIAEGTIVRAENWGFQGTADEVIANTLESTQGFSIVLCDLKTFLESGKSANLVRDKALQIQRN